MLTIYSISFSSLSLHPSILIRSWLILHRQLQSSLIKGRELFNHMRSLTTNFICRAISLNDVLQGLKYVMDYRLKSKVFAQRHTKGNVWHLDKKLMKSLSDGLLSVIKSSTASQAKRGIFTFNRNSGSKKDKFTAENDLGLKLFLGFFEEVHEFRAVVTGYPVYDLSLLLKFYDRITVLPTIDASADGKILSPEEERSNDALQLLSAMIKHFPEYFSFSELVPDSSPKQAEVQAIYDGYKEIVLKEGPKFIERKERDILFPPPALYFERRSARVIDMFRTDPDKGLSSEQLTLYYEHYGFNDLPTPPKPSLLKMFLSQIFDFMILILIVASIISFTTHGWESGLVLIIVVVMNVLIGFIQEVKANKALNALLSLSVPTATVVRGGNTESIPARELVPGDIVILEEGDSVPADLRLIEVSQLEVIESILTGESVAVKKTEKEILARSRKVPIGDCFNCAFMSTVVSKGRAKGVVVRTGVKTEIGKISTSLSSSGKSSKSTAKKWLGWFSWIVEEEQTPLQKRLGRLGKYLVIISVVLCLLVVFIGMVGWNYDGREIVEIALSLAVSVIPEGLVAVVTVALAIGVTRMAKRKAIVRKLPSVETLGSVGVVCSDKTGTLTEGKMAAVKLWVNSGKNVKSGFYEFKSSKSGTWVDGSCTKNDQEFEITPADKSFEYAMMACALCNNSNLKQKEKEGKGFTIEPVGDPTEVALLVASLRAKRDKEYYATVGAQRIGEYAFDSDRKLMSVIYKFKKLFDKDDAHIVLVKGAPESVLDNSASFLNEAGNIQQITEEYEQQVAKKSTEMASLGLRVLGLALRNLESAQEAQSIIDSKDSKQAESNLTYIGLIGLIDPPRQGVKESVLKCREAGIKVIMITGDHVITAVAVAKELGILTETSQTGTSFLDGGAIKGVDLDLLSDENLKALKPFPNVFARVSPDNKLRIVSILQEKGYSVAMTGDGVNDAPAIKKATVGVAMGISGTEITKQSADIVLADDNFTTLEHAIEEGRLVFDNIQKFVVYLLSCNFSEIWIILIAISAGLASPFTSIMILYANIIADVPPSMAISMEEKEGDIMKREPRKPDGGVITKKPLFYIAFQSSIMASLSLCAYVVQLYVDGNLGSRNRDPHAQTLCYVVLTSMQLFQGFMSRSLEESIFTTGFLNNRYMVAAYFVSWFFLLLAVYVPGMNDFFELIPLTRGLDWAWVVGTLVVQITLNEIVKFFVRRHSRMKRLGAFDDGSTPTNRILVRVESNPADLSSA